MHMCTKVSYATDMLGMYPMHINLKSSLKILKKKFRHIVSILTYSCIKFQV
jgi:hypothetical protein